MRVAEEYITVLSRRVFEEMKLMWVQEGYPDVVKYRFETLNPEARIVLNKIARLILSRSANLN